MAKNYSKGSDGTDTASGSAAPDAPVSSADVTADGAATPVEAPAAITSDSSAADAPAPAPLPVASTALGADKLPPFDPLFGALPKAAPAPAVDPLADLPVQTDRPSYAKLLAAAKNAESITIRQIRARPSNQIMVGGVIVSRELKTVSLDSVLERGRAALHSIADDDTIEVYLVPEV